MTSWRTGLVSIPQFRVNFSKLPDNFSLFSNLTLHISINYLIISNLVLYYDFILIIAAMPLLLLLPLLMACGLRLAA